MFDDPMSLDDDVYTEPLNLLDLTKDCLNVIGEMVKEDNRERWHAIVCRTYSYPWGYYDACKKRYGFVTCWAMSEMMHECKRMCEKHPYKIPMTIRNYSTVWRYRTEVIVVGERWLDIWQACDALIRNAVDKRGDSDHRRFIEFIVQPDATNGQSNGYPLEQFFACDDPEYIRYSNSVDEDDNDIMVYDNIWYVITSKCTLGLGF